MKLTKMILTAILSISTVALADKGNPSTVQNLTQSRGYWVTTYNLQMGMKYKRDYGCVEPQQTVTFNATDVVQIEVTADPYCQRQVLCRTDTESHVAPISVYRDPQGGCYIDYIVNHEGQGGYQKSQPQPLQGSDVPDNML